MSSHCCVSTATEWWPNKGPFGQKWAFQVCPLIRKILVSVKFVSAILGPEMGAPILWTPGKMRSFCRKNHVRKIPLFWGGVWGGGGECRFYFYGRADFSELTNINQRPRSATPSHSAPRKCKLLSVVFAPPSVRNLRGLFLLAISVAFPGLLFNFSRFQSLAVDLSHF